MRSKELSVERRDRIGSRHRSREVYKQILQHWRAPRTQWPPSFLNGRSLEPPRLFLELAARPNWAIGAEGPWSGRWPRSRWSLWQSSRVPLWRWENLPEGQPSLQHSTNQVVTCAPSPASRSPGCSLWCTPVTMVTRTCTSSDSPGLHDFPDYLPYIYDSLWFLSQALLFLFQFHVGALSVCSCFVLCYVY